MNETVVVALITGIPSTIAAFAALRSARSSGKTHTEVQTGNGMTSGQTQTYIKDELMKLSGRVDAHISDDRAHKE